MHLFQVDKSGVKDSNWSAEGVSPITKDYENLTLVIPEGGLDGCPSTEQFFEQFEIVSEFLSFYVDDQSPDIFDSVDVTKLNITSVPISFTKSLRQLKEEIDDEEEAKMVYQEQFDKITYMESFIPKSLLKNNIGYCINHL